MTATSTDHHVAPPHPALGWGSGGLDLRPADVRRARRRLHAVGGAHVYAWVQGIEDPTFTVDTPLAWGFYAVAFGIAALARRTERWAQLTVLAYLVSVLGIALFYYPTTFGVEKQTMFGWFENDVYVGLLVVATYLGVLRLRRVSLTPA